MRCGVSLPALALGKRWRRRYFGVIMRSHGSFMAIWKCAVLSSYEEKYNAAENIALVRK